MTFQPEYDQARELLPILPPTYEPDPPASASDPGDSFFNGLTPLGIPRLQEKLGQTPTPHNKRHEIGHAVDALLDRWSTTFPGWHHEPFWSFELDRGVVMPGSSWTAALAEANRMIAARAPYMAVWQTLPGERFAEVVAAALEGTDPDALAFVRELIYQARPMLRPKEVVVTTTRNVVDYYSPKGAEFMACLAAAGVDGIARYLTNSPTDERQVTADEIAAAHAAGLAVHFWYEMSPTYAAYFTFAQGAEDCRQAVERLRELGAPDGTVVYFAVDAPPSRIPVAVLDNYVAGIESMATPQIAPGLYGYQAHVEYARRRFPDGVGAHVAQTYGTVTGRLDLWQHEQDAMCGVSVDLNEATVDGWRNDVATEERIRAIAVQAIADAGLDGHTVDVIKHKIDDHVHVPIPSIVQTSPPLFPPVPGAIYAGDSADFSEIVWMYPDGTRHTWIGGRDQTPPA